MAPTPLPPSADTDPHSALQDGLLRAFFGMSAAVSVLGAGAALALGRQLATGARLAMVIGYGALALVAVAGLRQPAGQAGRWMPLQVLGGLAVIGSVGAITGWGLQTPGLVFFGLLVCLGNTVGTPRVAWLATGGAMVLLVALGLAERFGWLPADADGPPLASRLVTHGAVVISATLIGRALAQLLRQHLLAAQTREQRFRTLLGIAASAYFETDATLRLSRVFWRKRDGQFMPQPATVGRLPWELTSAVPGQPDADADALRVAMLAQAAVHEVAVCWQLPGGPVKHGLVNAEPRRAEDGSFIGYWGVVRDTTAEHRGRQALRRSQSLLAQVVSLSPDVITLTDLHSGRYVMVSDSFCRLMGRTAADVVGRTSVDVGVWRNIEDRERLVQAVWRDGTVQDLYLEFVVNHGRVVPMLISGTRFHSEGQDYLLLNGRDVSEMARERLEREAILANASVGIAFLRQGRFVLANAPFEQMFGWAPGTLTGQPSDALWADPTGHDAMIDELTPVLQRGGSVDLERTALRHDGSAFQLRLRAKAIDPRNLRDSGTILIAEDVTAARQAEQALADARDAAEAASRAKSAFLANTSHEIRTPLNGLLGLARLARQPGLAPALRQQYVEQIGDSAELLAMVITDILDVAKIEAGKLQLEAAPFNLHALLQALQRSHAALAAEKGLVFEIHLDAGLPHHVLGDALRLRQILGNLLHNALKFTGAGSIRLAAFPLTGDWLRFEVHDTGPGIDAATQARLFEPFSQADASITRRYGGTGLGLAICRELTVLMGGHVGLDSAAGRGSVFHVELPLPTLPGSAPTDAVILADVARLQGMRVLLVEDNEVNMLVASALLTQWGVAVTPAVDGQQALDEVARAAAGGRLFDAVLMDLQMPGLSGFEATEVLRRQHGPAELPVIALTAAALASEREQAARFGMNAFLTKPIDPLRLREALLHALAQRHDGLPPG